MSSKFVAVHPVLPVRSVPAAIAYYTQKLGFRLRGTDVPGNPQYAVIERDGVTLHLQSHAPDDFMKVDMLALRFLIDDVDSLFAEYQVQAVFHDRTALRNTAWGTREFGVYDPDGNALIFYRDQ